MYGNHIKYKKGDSMFFQNKPYVILDIFPIGTQGVVYKILGWNKKDQFALKIVNEISEKELQITKWLQKNHHQNIVNIIDIEIKDKEVQILMECCEINLFQDINQKILDQKELRYFMISIAKGLQFLHSNQIIHRDLKPENILITTLTDKNNKELKQKIYKLADFGLSLQQNCAKTKYIGTCYYMAPELLNNLNELYNNKVDIWSFGTIIYELLCGQTLFTGFTMQQIYNQIQNLDKVENQKQLNEKLSIIKDEYYFELVSNMLKYNPNDRYDINQVINKLQKKDQNIIRNRSSSCNDQAVTNQQQLQLKLNRNSFQIPVFISENFPIQIQPQFNKYNKPQIFNVNQQNQYQQMNINKNNYFPNQQQINKKK